MQQQQRIMRRTFISYLTRYLGISLLAIALLLPLYFSASNSASQALIDQVGQTLRQNFAALENRLATLQLYAGRLAQSDDIQRLALCKEDDDRFATALYVALNFYKSNLWDYDFMQNVYVQFARNDALIALGKVYPQKAFCLENELAAREYSPSALLDMLYRDQLAAIGPVSIGSDGATDALLFNHYYNSYEGEPSIIVTFVVPTASMIHALVPADVLSECRLTITQELHNASYTVERVYAESGDTVPFVISGNRSQLRLSLNVSKAFFTRSTRSTQRMLVAYVLIACFVAVISSLWLTRRSMKPTLELFRMLADMNLPAQGERDSYEVISHAIGSMRTAESSVRQDYTRLREYYLCHILRTIGSGMHVASSDRMLLVQGTPALQGVWRVIQARMDWFDDESESKKTVVLLALKQRLADSFSDTLFLEEEPMQAILKEHESLLPELERIASDIQKAFGVYAYFGVSQPMSALAQLRTAFEQAVNTLSPARETTGLVAVFEEGKQEKLPPMVNREQLTQMLTSATPDALYAYFRGIVQDLETTCSSVNARMVYYAVLSVAQHVATQHQFPPPSLQEYGFWPSMREALSFLEQACSSLQASLIEQRRQTYTEQARQLVQFVDDHLSNSSLCLTMVADAMKMNDRKVSALIMQYTGLRFAEYVEGKRMEMAKACLRESSLPVNDIAIRVGYASANTFYRAFRQFTGVSPTQYRIGGKGQ